MPPYTNDIMVQELYFNDPEYKKGTETIDEGLKMQANAFRRAQEKSKLTTLLSKFQFFSGPEEIFFHPLILADNFFPPKIVSFCPGEIEIITQLLKKELQMKNEESQ